MRRVASLRSLKAVYAATQKGRSSGRMTLSELTDNLQAGIASLGENLSKEVRAAESNA